MRKAFVALALAILAAAGGFLGFRVWDGGQESAIGRMRPEFALPDLAGELQSIAQWDGRPLLVNFWATWCAPCRREIPLLASLQEEYGDRGLQVIGIAIDDAAAVKEYSEAMQISYPVLVGEQEAIDALTAFGAQVVALPQSIFTDSRGRIVALHARELHREQAVEFLERSLPD